MGRPSFNEAWSAFGKVNFPVADVGRIIGGNVGQNISGGYFENACPIRMSYVLNATGFSISRSSPYATVSGSDKKFYIYRVNDMIEHLTQIMGSQILSLIIQLLVTLQVKRHHCCKRPWLEQCSGTCNIMEW